MIPFLKPIMISPFLLTNPPVSNDQDKRPDSRVNQSVIATNKGHESPGNAPCPTEIKPGRFEQSISVGSPDNLF
jgi:hypothetical protein